MLNPLALQSQTYSGQTQSQLRERADSPNQLGRKRESSGQAVAEFVYRGEIQETETYQKYYRPQFNQQIAPQNRSAIDDYQSTSRGGRAIRSVGLILDSYI